MLGCRKGETIASIGAGNGTTEVAISCFVDRIDWYLQEIDSARLFEFHRVREYFEKLYGKKTEANFNLVLGTESSTNLPESTFDRILMVNVYHELTNREAMMNDISKLLKQNGKLVIMEPMAKQAGDLHANCKHLKLYEPDFLQEMRQFGFKLSKRDVGEKISLVTYYTFLYK
ncbi:MAG: methyltransferase domain-containing protein [Cytophagales bacterium]|nr:methyltransferase domain-containing protein [Cytophagales bacterium]